MPIRADMKFAYVRRVAGKVFPTHKQADSVCHRGLIQHGYIVEDAKIQQHHDDDDDEDDFHSATDTMCVLSDGSLGALFRVIVIDFLVLCRNGHGVF